MDYRILSRLLGLLLLLLAVAELACLIYALIDKEMHPEANAAVRSFAISIALTATVGIGLFLGGHPPGASLLRKEAVATVGLGWLICGLFGALPYMLCKPSLGIAAAFFESMSGFTTTGSTVIRDLRVYPDAVLLWRSITQWLGGMGILVLFVAVLSFLGVGSKSIFRHESSGYGSGGFKARIRETALMLWEIYIVLTVVCAGGLLMLGMNWFEALNHAFTTISTGGFSIRNESIAYYDSAWIDLWITLFMFLGGCSFMLMAWLLRGRYDRLRSEEEVRVYALLLLVATLTIALLLRSGGTVETYASSVRLAVFQVVSIMTTTGFATANFDEWPALGRGILIVLMFIGGCAGSTAGGIKVGRVILFLRITRAELIAAFRPVQIVPLKLNGRVASENLKPQTLFFIAFTGFLVAVGTLGVSFLEPELDLLSAFSGIVATLFNIGPGLGSLGPTCNFADLHGSTLLLMSLLMALGRLELFAILVLFVPSLWRKY